MIASFISGIPIQLLAQDNYEIQVYSSELTKSHHTMLELHSNYTLNGTKEIQDGLYASNHAIHETLEITHGFSKWIEVGTYLFTSLGTDNRTDITGFHLRPRIAVPDEFHWPFGVSLSAETGYQNPHFFGCQWTAEIRPILDKMIKRFYFSLNPTFDKCLYTDKENGFEFSPSVKADFEVSKKVALGLEYYASLGAVQHFEPVAQQRHQLFGAVDWDFDPDWEFNAGIGYGLTDATDRWVIKFILGYRLPF